MMQYRGGLALGIDALLMKDVWRRLYRLYQVWRRFSKQGFQIRT